MKKFILGSAVLLGMALPLHAQIADYFSANATYLGQINGQPVLQPASAAFITVCLVSGTSCVTTTVFQDSALSITQPQPFHADRLGNFGFYAAPGTYRYTACFLGLCTTYTLPTGR